METILKKIYGNEKGTLALNKIKALLNKYPLKNEKYQDLFSEKDIILITYGDSIKNKTNEKPLQTLHRFAGQYFKNIFSTIHILPFYPFSSDDGFSVMDFFAVDDELGTWEDIKQLGNDFKLMFDYVLNHVSAKGDWFANYLENKDTFENLAIEVDPSMDLSKVTRPRALPLLTKVIKKSGETTHVWTTFSADQIDINFDSLEILEKMIEVVLYYVKQGATILRLDAIAYLWKEIGTNCIHLPKTHEMVKLFRCVLDHVAPEVIILTETNVPHDENISYFGDGKNEAQMVYNFTLPPLLLYSFVMEDSSILTKWARGLDLESDSTTFFNFTASHDGIGVRPLEGILPASEVENLAEIVKKNGGAVSYKKNSDGSESPYELNITYVDAYLRGDEEEDEGHADRFLASQAIQLTLPGVPAIYIHSILGSHNWTEGVKLTKRARTINRAKLDVDEVMSQLNDPDSFRSKVFYPYLKMIKVRRDQPSFHPKADYKMLNLDQRVFAIKRSSESQEIIALTNVSSMSVNISLSDQRIPSQMNDLLSGEKCKTDTLKLLPYESIWLSTLNP